MNSDSLLEVKSLKDADGNLITGATVQATVYEDDRATEVGGQAWPLSLTDNGSGNYSAVLEDTMTLVLGRRYWIKVVIESGGADDTRWQRVVAALRPFNG